MNREKLIKCYIEDALEQGKEPNSVFAFCKAHKWKETEFYEHFSDFNDLIAAIWSDTLRDYYNEISSAEIFNSYGVREKVLALFFGYIERLLEKRSFFIMVFKENREFSITDKIKSLHRLRKTFLAIIEPILKNAESIDQIPSRRFISSSYKELLWLNFIYVLYFWLNDRSPSFEQTDACIEKSVQLSMELIERNTLDQVLDFGKFVFNHSMK